LPQLPFLPLTVDLLFTEEQNNKGTMENNQEICYETQYMPIINVDPTIEAK
jgi:hypothetical protein